jgi:hypothetical protein
MQTVFNEGQYYKPDCTKMSKTHLELVPIYQTHLRNIGMIHETFRVYSNKYPICQNTIRRRNEAYKKWIHYSDKLQRIRPATD